MIIIVPVIWLYQKLKTECFIFIWYDLSMFVSYIVLFCWLSISIFLSMNLTQSCHKQIELLASMKLVWLILNNLILTWNLFNGLLQTACENVRPNLTVWKPLILYLVWILENMFHWCIFVWDSIHLRLDICTSCKN